MCRGWVDVGSELREWVRLGFSAEQRQHERRAQENVTMIPPLGAFVSAVPRTPVFTSQCG
eukprot:1266996-Rhodomonas_salina.6